MRVVIVNKENEIDLAAFSNMIKKGLIDNNLFKEVDVEIIEDINKLKLVYDVYILVVNDIEEFLICSKKIKEANKVLILTKNSNTNFIMSCISYTKNLLYLYVNIDMILKKVITMYSENNKLNIEIGNENEK